MPLDWPKYDSKFSGPTVGCVVDKINQFKLVIMAKSKRINDRRFALRFLIHCVEDMHQPCHAGDNGGNRTQVRFFDKGTNMHALWDTGMIERVSKSESVWLDDLAKLDSPEARQEAMKGSVEDWGDREPATRKASLPGARDGHAVEVRSGAGRCVRGGEPAGGAEAAVPGEFEAGDGAQ